MRQLLFVEPKQLEWQDAPDPELQGPGEAVVRPIAASNCDLDTAVVRGDVPLPGPFPICHEFVAEVVEAGEDVTSFARGDVVIVPWKISCGTCGSCRRGVTAGCTAVPPLAMFAQAQYFLAHRNGRRRLVLEADGRLTHIRRIDRRTRRRVVLARISHRRTGHVRP